MRKIAEKKRGRCLIEWIDAGEGHHGRFNPDDKEDFPLLRFRCYGEVDGEWVPVQNGSVLTQVGRHEDRNMKRTLLKRLLDRIEPKVEEAIKAGHVKNGTIQIENGAEFFEKLSWFGPEMAEEY